MAEIWTLKERIPIDWSLVWKGGTCKPYFKLGKYGKPILLAADWHDAEGHYRGASARSQIHPATCKALEAWIDMTTQAMREIDMHDWTGITF